MPNFKYAVQGAGVLVILLALATSDANSASPGATATSWTLQRGHDISARPTRVPKLRMEGQKLSGSTGCNSFTATLTEKADKRVAIEGVALTRMLCAPTQNEIEAAVVKAFGETEYVEQKGRSLTFLSGKRQPLLVWTRSGKLAAERPARGMHHARYQRRPAAAARAGCWGWWTGPTMRRTKSF